MDIDRSLVFVVEDNDWYNKYLVHTLSLNPDYTVESFTNGADMIKALHRNPAIITLDYRLPDHNGEELLREIKAFNPSIEVILISEQQDIETAIQLLRGGAYDYIPKTKEIRERLINIVNHINRNSTLNTELKTLKKEVQKKYDFQESIIGSSPVMEKVFDRIRKSLDLDIVVSISGETGTGKELVAKAIHYNSERKDKPFVPVNIAALPADLMESELFGHENGAFTGANARRIGKFEEADGGTIFLDEIAEIDKNIQKKLLRVLQEKEVVRVGSNQPVPTSCRVIIATNLDLKQEVAKGHFREDLYYRLVGIPIHMPPLRDRGNDVLVLARHFLDKFTGDNNLGKKRLSEEARTKLMKYRWPGNIRELKSAIELAAVMATGDEIQADEITFESPTDGTAELLQENLSLREYNQRIVEHFMEKFGNDTKKVAEALDIGQTTVYRLLKEVREKQSRP